MKVRRKQKTEDPRCRHLARAPGLGRKSGAVGNASIVSFLKKRLKGPATKRREYFANLADELAHVMASHAADGHVGMMAMILDRTESRNATNRQVDAVIEKVHSIVTHYIRDDRILEKIATAISEIKLEE